MCQFEEFGAWPLDVVTAAMRGAHVVSAYKAAVAWMAAQSGGRRRPRRDGDGGGQEGTYSECTREAAQWEQLLGAMNATHATFTDLCLVRDLAKGGGGGGGGGNGSGDAGSSSSGGNGGSGGSGGGGGNDGSSAGSARTANGGASLAAARGRIPGLDAWLVSAYALLCGGLQQRAQKAEAEILDLRRQLRASADAERLRNLRAILEQVQARRR
jgi:hypothetical protein